MQIVVPWYWWALKTSWNIKYYDQFSHLQITLNNALWHKQVTKDWMEEPEQSQIQNGTRHTESEITIWLACKGRGNNEFKMSNRGCPSLCAQFAAWHSPFSWINYWKEESRCVCTSPCLNGKGSLWKRTRCCVQLGVHRLTPLLLPAQNKALTETPSWSALEATTGCLGQTPPDLLHIFFQGKSRLRGL